MPDQRAASGTQKTLTARYSSRSSGSDAGSFSKAARFSSKVSEMYLRKMRPRTTFLYSEASMWPRSLSAAAQSLSSKPRLALEAALEGFLAPAGLRGRPEVGGAASAVFAGGAGAATGSGFESPGL